MPSEFYEPTRFERQVEACSDRLFIINNPCDRFEHVLEVVVTTQFRESDIALRLQQRLGPWCKSTKLIQTVDTEETTK